MSPAVEAAKSMELISAKEAGDLLGLRPKLIYHYLARTPGLKLERVGGVLGIRIEDVPRIRDTVQASREQLARRQQGLSSDGQWLTAGKAAELLGISVRTLRRKTLSGEIPGRKVEEPGEPVAWHWDPRTIWASAQLRST